MNRSARRISWEVLALGFCLLLSSGPLLAEGGGATLFKGRCAACHGADGSGNTALGKSMKLHDFSSPEVQKLSDAELTAIITNGKGGMPSYKDKLTSEQIKQIVSFIRTLKKG